jgi:hypothetical protein
MSIWPSPTAAETIVITEGHVVAYPAGLSPAQERAVRLLAREAKIRAGHPWVEDPSDDCVAAVLAAGLPPAASDADTTRALIAHSAIAHHIGYVGATVARPEQAAAMMILAAHPDLAGQEMVGRCPLHGGLVFRRRALLDLVRDEGYLVTYRRAINPDTFDDDDGATEASFMTVAEDGERAADYVLRQYPAEATAILAYLSEAGRRAEQQRTAFYTPSAWYLDGVDRQRIAGYRYAPELAAAINRLEAAGALRQGYFSWLGGDHIPADGVQRTYSDRPARAAEKIARLRNWLAECSQRHPAHAGDIAAALALVTADSIVEIHG